MTWNLPVSFRYLSGILPVSFRYAGKTYSSEFNEERLGNGLGYGVNFMKSYIYTLNDYKNLWVMVCSEIKSLRQPYENPTNRYGLQVLTLWGAEAERGEGMGSYKFICLVHPLYNEYPGNCVYRDSSR